jgi:hypothetical protein
MRAWRGVAAAAGLLVGVGAAWAGEQGSQAVHPHSFGVFLPNSGFDGKVVKGVPYQAEAETEIVQTLADGNRIVRKTTSAVFRDSEGRTRREQALGAIGPLVASGGTPPTAFIHDPVAGVSYVLEAETRVARRVMMPPPRHDRPATDESDETDKPSDFFFTIAVPGPDGRMPPPGHSERKALPKPQIEALGHQTIEGIDTEGTRSTTTIPAGDIGNERELKIVSERWYSADLQTVISSKRTDPRLGETTYRLTGISRNEPDHALFEVPAGFTVKDGPPEMNFRYERRMDSTTPRNPAP